MKGIRKPRKGTPRPKNLLPRPAPGRLHIVQDFINTRDDDMERDEVASPEALSRWLADRKLLPAVTPIDQGTWRTALEAREGLRALIRTHSGLPLAEKALVGLNRALHAAQPFVALGPEGRISLQSAETGWAGVMTQLIDMVVEGILEGHWQRLKTCHNPRCQWVYYDASRNRSGKWCNVRRCGNRIHTKTYRRRGPSHTRRAWVPPIPTSQTKG